jgi:hypothetical protein
VAWEGPAIYAARIEGPGVLRFHGVSYAAEVAIDGRQILRHEGMWDAFDVPLPDGPCEITVAVTKSGGSRFPVRDVAGGFLPYVFHTFGGIYRPVAQFSSPPPEPTAPPCRYHVEGRRIFDRGKPVYVRGILGWGWYPELGHPNPDLATIRREIDRVQALGFNLVKFCLWVPPHEYVQELERRGMHAWMELPLWAPTEDPARLSAIADELLRIVAQYAHHPNVLAWTIGCELSDSTPAEYRQGLVERVKKLTGSPLVKDNSGGAEMYGGDLREFGDFEDYHPYCDTPFFPLVLDALLPGPRRVQPILLGETNDADHHVSLRERFADDPYWASPDPQRNDQGVRWQYDLPRIRTESPLAQPGSEERNRRLQESSRQKGLFMRKYVHEHFRARSEIGGFVLTGLADTPISTSGILLDDGSPRFDAAEFRPFNGPDVLFPIPIRRPQWTEGGNRAGWRDPTNVYQGAFDFRVGLATEAGFVGTVEIELDGMARETFLTAVEALGACYVGEIHMDRLPPGEYRLRAVASSGNSWPIWVVETALPKVRLNDPRGRLSDLKDSGTGPTVGTEPTADVAFLVDEGTVAMPFWREAAYEFHDPDFWARVPFAEQWYRLLPISPDRSLDPNWLTQTYGDYEVLMNRVDVRTYAEHPILVRAGRRLITTLRPFGGLGIQPVGVRQNPAGLALLRALVQEVL